METILIAILLIVVGLASALGGYLLFKLLLPVIGFIVGFGVGFSGVIGIFGTNVISLPVAVITAFVVGLIFAMVSYLYYTIGVMILFGSLVAGAFALVGQALGLSPNGFVIFLLSLTGAIIGALAVLRHGLQNSLVIAFTAFFGVSSMLLSFFLLFGNLTVSDIYRDGVLGTISQTVDSSWIWLFVLIGGSIFASALQSALILRAAYDSPYIIDEKSKAIKA